MNLEGIVIGLDGREWRVNGDVCMQRHQNGWHRAQGSLAGTGLSEWPLLMAPDQPSTIHHQDPSRKRHTRNLHAVTNLGETQQTWEGLDGSCPFSTTSSQWILDFISGQALRCLTAGQVSRTVHILVLVGIGLWESEGNSKSLFVSDFILNKITFFSYGMWHGYFLHCWYIGAILFPTNPVVHNCAIML